MDPSILSFERPASSSGPSVPSSGDVSLPTENSTTASLQSGLVALEEGDVASPRYVYSIDTLQVLKDSPLVTCPEIKEDTSAWIYSGYDNQQAKYRPNRREWGDKNGSHGAHNSPSNSVHNNINSSTRNRRVNMRETTDKRKKLPGFFDTDAQEREPEWMESLDEPSGGDNLAMMDMGRTVEEFEAWKAKMRMEEMKAAGIPIPEKRDEPKSEDFTSASAEAPSVDRMFGMWGGSSSSLHSRTEDIARPSSSAASKFSRFFSPSTESGNVTANPASANNSPQDQKSAPTTQNPNPAPEPDADQQGFQRILQMLDNSNQPHPSAALPQQKQRQQRTPPKQDSNIANSQQRHQQHQSQQQQQPQSIPPASISNNNGNDLFFQSLLNKSGPPTETNEQKNNLDRISLSNPANQAASSPSNAHINNMHMYPPPPPPGMMHHGPPPGMFENMPPLPPGMMFPPPPPPPGFDRSSAHPMFPPPPGFPPPFFGGNYPPPPMNGRPPRGQQPLDGNGQPLGSNQVRDRAHEPR